MPNKLTDNEIKMALECCSQSGDFTKTQDEICSPCPYSSYGDCTGLLKANALDLINRQEEKNESLKQVIHDLECGIEKDDKACEICHEKCRTEMERLQTEVERLKGIIKNAQTYIEDILKITGT